MELTKISSDDYLDRGWDDDLRPFCDTDVGAKRRTGSGFGLQAGDVKRKDRWAACRMVVKLASLVETCCE